MRREPELRTHGEALRAIRKKSVKTAEAVARYAGMSRQAIYNAENGQRNIEREKLERIADFLDIPLAAITCQCGRDPAGNGPAATAA